MSEPDAVALLLDQFPDGHPAVDELIGIRSACRRLHAENARLRHQLYVDIKAEEENLELRAEIEQLRAALREDRKYLAGLCGCAASSGCGAAIRRVEIDRLLNSEQKATDGRG